MTRGCSPWLRAMVTVEPTSTSWRSPPCSQANVTHRTRVHRVGRASTCLVRRFAAEGWRSWVLAMDGTGELPTTCDVPTCTAKTPPQRAVFHVYSETVAALRGRIGTGAAHLASL